MTPFGNPAVAAKFDSYPPKARRRMLALRDLVLQTAARTPGVGDIEESLKWGEPAYATRNGAGSTIRMDWKSKAPEHYAMYFHCQTNLVGTFRTLFARELEFEGNRATVLALEDKLPRDALALCIAASLTYHLAKSKSERRLTVPRKSLAR